MKGVTVAYRKILVGTDGSPTAERAVAEAAALAAAVGSELIVSSAYLAWEVPPEDLTPESYMATSAAGAEDIVGRGKAVARQAGVEARTRTDPGDRPGPSLLEVADELEVDLVVVGNKGMTGAKRFLLGSVPDYIAHHADCDVLICRTTD